jgi:hypothetical protein
MHTPKGIAFFAKSFFFQFPGRQPAARFRSKIAALSIDLLTGEVRPD